MTKTNAKKLACSLGLAEIKVQILALETGIKLLARCGEKLLTDGQPDLLTATGDLLAKSAQDVDSLYTSMYQLGFRHGTLFGVAAAEGMPKLPETAGGRCSLVGYVRGMLEALELQRELLLREFQTRVGAPVNDTDGKAK